MSAPTAKDRERAIGLLAANGGAFLIYQRDVAISTIAQAIADERERVTEECAGPLARIDSLLGRIADEAAAIRARGAS